MASTNSQPTLVQSYKSKSVSMYLGNAMRPKVVVVGGASGSRVHSQILTSSSASSNSAKLYHIERLTLQSAMGTGAFVDGGGGSDTITRSSGSFITDGWLVGDLLIVSNATTLANDFAVRLTAVAADTLTFATATVDTAENLPTGAILYKASLVGTIAVAAGSGNTAGTFAVDLIGTDGFIDADASPNRYRTIGANNGFAVSLGTTLGAGEYVNITTMYADY